MQTSGANYAKMASAAAAGVSSIIGTWVARQAAKKGYRQALNEYGDRLKQVRAHRDAVYYQDPTQTAESQAAVTQAQQVLDEQSKRSRGTQAVTGGTDEGVALQKQAAAATVGNMMQQQAVAGAQQKEQAYRDAAQVEDAFTKYLADIKLQRGLTNAQALQNHASNMAMSFYQFGQSFG